MSYDSQTSPAVQSTCTKCGTSKGYDAVYNVLDCHKCGEHRLRCYCVEGFELCPDHPLCSDTLTTIACAKCGTTPKTLGDGFLTPEYCHRCGLHIKILCDCYGYCQELCPAHPANYVQPKQPCPDCGDARCKKDSENKCLCYQCGDYCHPGESCICPGCGRSWHMGLCPC